MYVQLNDVNLSAVANIWEFKANIKVKDASRPLIDTLPHFEYPSHVRAGPARQSLPNPARVERQQR